MFRFFVLSGYLITMILSNKELTGEKIMDFYKRRIIRIIPCYLLLLIFVIAIGLFILTSNGQKELIDQSFYATLLMSNIRPLIMKEDYFTEVSIFSHS